jgi:hypothetical protein
MLIIDMGLDVSSHLVLCFRSSMSYGELIYFFQQEWQTEWILQNVAVSFDLLVEAESASLSHSQRQRKVIAIIC